MNDLKETPVVTLKAELVEDFNFEKTVRIVNKFNQRTLVYPSNFRVVTPIKVGNSIKDVNFSINYEGYMDLTPFKILIDAGITIDFDDVSKKYEKQLNDLKEAIALEEEELEKEYKLKKYNDWSNSWIHEFNGLILDKKFSNFNNVKVEKIDRKEYSENIHADLYVNVTYKNLSTKIFKSNSDGRYCFSEATRKIGDRTETAYISSFLNTRSYGSKTRKANTIKAIFHKFLTEVDKYIRVNELRVYRLNKEENECNAKLEELKDVFDCMVILEKNHKASYLPGKSGYYVHEYFIQKGERKIQIDINHNTSYKDGKTEIIDKLYRFGSIFKLTQTQVRAIIKVLEQ